MMMNQNIPTAKYHAKTHTGFEPLVADELRKHGATEIEVGRRGVGFTATAEVMYRHCLQARFTLRVLRILHSFQAKNTDELYRLSARWSWEDILSKDGTFTIDSTIYSDDFKHDQFATLRLKDAIVDRFRAKTGIRPSVDRTNPDARIHLHISKQAVTISLDASGDPLSRRGYRSRKAIAPLNEVLELFHGFSDSGIKAVPAFKTETLTKDSRRDIAGPECGLDGDCAGTAQRVRQTGRAIPAGRPQQRRRQGFPKRRFAGFPPITAPVEWLAGDIQVDFHPGPGHINENPHIGSFLSTSGRLP